MRDDQYASAFLHLFFRRFTVKHGFPKSAIEPSPQLSKEQGKLLSRMANLEKQKRMVQLLDPPYLMEDGEMAALSAIAA